MSERVRTRIRPGSRGRVQVFHPSDDSYGLDRVLLRVVDVLSDDGWVVRCELEAGNPGTGWVSDALSQRRIEFQKRPLANLVRSRLTGPVSLLRWIVAVIVAIPSIVRLARSGDVVYVNGFTLVAAAAAARISRRRVVWHLHEIPPAGRHLGRLVRLLSHRQICVSHAVADAFGLANATSCTVIHNAVDVPPDPVAQPHVDDDQPLEVGIVARINRGKGHLVLAEAFKQVVARNLPVRLHVVGSPHASDTSVATEFAERLKGLPDEQIIWAGEVPSGAAYMAHLHVLAAPSVRPDPFPLSVLEGMAAGLAVVASDAGGHREALVSGVTGLLCKAGDADDLAEKLALLATDDDLRRRLARSGRDDVATRFSPSCFAAKLNEVMRPMSVAARPGS